MTEEYEGVTYSHSEKAWCAWILIKKKRVIVGYHPTSKEAHALVVEAHKKIVTMATSNRKRNLTACHDQSCTDPTHVYEDEDIYHGISYSHRKEHESNPWRVSITVKNRQAILGYQPTLKAINKMLTNLAGEFYVPRKLTTTSIARYMRKVTMNNLH